MFLHKFQIAFTLLFTQQKKNNTRCRRYEGRFVCLLYSSLSLAFFFDAWQNDPTHWKSRIVCFSFRLEKFLKLTHFQNSFKTNSRRFLSFEIFFFPGLRKVKVSRDFNVDKEYESIKGEEEFYCDTIWRHFIIILQYALPCVGCFSTIKLISFLRRSKLSNRPMNCELKQIKMSFSFPFIHSFDGIRKLDNGVNFKKNMKKLSFKNEKNLKNFKKL